MDLSHSLGQKQRTVQKNKELREASYHLAIKIIRWRTGIHEKKDKITPTEWKKYKIHMTASIPEDKLEILKQTKLKIKETEEAISKRGGFV